MFLDTQDTMERLKELFTDHKGKVMFSQVSVSHSVHDWPHGYSVTTHSCYSAVGSQPTGILSYFKRKNWRT